MGCTQSPDLLAHPPGHAINRKSIRIFLDPVHNHGQSAATFCATGGTLPPIAGETLMTVRVGIIMDPIAQIAFKKDSSLAMLLAAQARKLDTLLYGAARPLSARQPGPRTHALAAGLQRPAALVRDRRGGRHGPADLDVILMRKDPPFNSEYVYATYLLELAEKAGTLVVNRPQSLRDCNEKFFATQFRSAHRRPWSADAPTFSASLPTSTVTSFSNPWTKWAAPRSSVIARATPICP